MSTPTMTITLLPFRRGAVWACGILTDGFFFTTWEALAAGCCGTEDRCDVRAAGASARSSAGSGALPRAGGADFLTTVDRVGGGGEEPPARAFPAPTPTATGSGFRSLAGRRTAV